MSADQIHYFGIRHHGPGSAERLVAALNRLQPAAVLIEGPADCTELFAELANPHMVPPVALLSYVADDASLCSYFPFAEFSPEYQACVWSQSNNAHLELIDLPVAIRLAADQADATLSLDAEEDTEEGAKQAETLAAESADPKMTAIINDPIGAIAQLAGYDDGESWWNDVIEQNRDDDANLFETVAMVMSALRDEVQQQPGYESHPAMQRDLPREAHMRLAIAKAAKDIDGPIAVVCGAWHLPALKEKHTAKSDRALLATLPKKLPPKKLRNTWVPWTFPRLASRSGYGAGVDAPKWYQHLWQYRGQHNGLEHWLAAVAWALRSAGHIVSTASIIEAVRLSQSLAALRGRPAVGYEELREAIVACLCFGETLLWEQLENTILLGNEVGEIPPDSPLMPLLEDLQKLQKTLKMKPEALPKELAVDLRSQAGTAKSELLHRLNLLGVPWGKLQDSGSSRGTFRERWSLSWEPEYAVALVDNLVYGGTIALASAAKLCERLRTETQLGELALGVQQGFDACLDEAIDVGLSRLETVAAETADCLSLLNAIAPLVAISRYGTARAVSRQQVATLVQRLGIQAAIALPYGCRSLNEEEATRHRLALADAHQAILLAELDDSFMEGWWQAFMDVVDSPLSAQQCAGICARCLYQAERIDAEQLQTLLQKMLSPAIPAVSAAAFFEGFFDGAVDRLLYDDILRHAVEDWLVAIDDEDFSQFLPLLRRTFASLDAMERKRLMDAVARGRSTLHDDSTPIINTQAIDDWQSQLQRLAKLLNREKTWNL